MTNEKTLLMKALRAAGHEQAADLANAILDDPEPEPAKDEPAPEPEGLTLEKVRAMDEGEINSRWGEVAAFMQSEPA